MFERLPHPKNVLEFGYPVFRENTSISPIIISDYINTAIPIINTGNLYKKPGHIGLFWKPHGGIEIDITNSNLSNPLTSDLSGGGFDLTDFGDIETSVHSSINTAISSRVLKSGDTMSGDLSLGNNNLTSILISEYNYTTKPTTNPSAQKVKIYTKDDDNIYILNSSGVETLPGSRSTLQDVYNNSAINPIILTDGDGAVVFRQGAGAPDKVLKVNNTSDITTFAIQGDGVMLNNGKTIIGVNNGLGTSGNILVGSLYSGITLSINNTAMGDESLNLITTGGDNTTVGRLSGNTITTGGYNTCIGSNSNVDSVDAEYRIAIGYNSVSDTNRHFTIGSSTPLQSITAIKPGTTDECELGTPTNRFKRVYCTSGVISDITHFTTNSTIDSTTNSIVTVSNASTIIITLPSAPINGSQYTIINTNYGDVMITRGGTDTIDDGLTTTIDMINIHDRVTLLYVNTVWYII